MTEAMRAIQSGAMPVAQNASPSPRQHEDARRVCLGGGPAGAAVRSYAVLRGRRTPRTSEFTHVEGPEARVVRGEARLEEEREVLRQQHVLVEKNGTAGD